MLQRPTSQTSYIPSLTSSAFKSTSFLRQKHRKGSFCLPAAVSCQNMQVAAISTINMMYSLCMRLTSQHAPKECGGAGAMQIYDTQRELSPSAYSHAPASRESGLWWLNTFTPPWQNSMWEKYSVNVKCAIVWMHFHNFACGNWHCWKFSSHPLVWEVLESFKVVLLS